MALAKLLSSEAKVMLLKLFLLNPKKRYYMREIEASLGRPLSTFQEALKSLESLGLLKTERVANLKYYSVNEGCSIYPELKNIILKTEGLGSVLKDNISGVGEIEFAFIYGSTAKGTEQLSSDIDLIVIGDVDADRLHEAITQAEKNVGREINYSIFSPSEVKKRVKTRDNFMMTALSGPKIMLIGEEDELSKTYQKS